MKQLTKDGVTIGNILRIQVAPHKAAAEASKIGNLLERLVVVNHGWQSESTDDGQWLQWSPHHNCWMQCSVEQLSLQL